MGTTWRQKVRNFFHVNLFLLPFKAHYFLYSAGSSGVVPIYSLLAKSLGISATAYGLTNTVIPFIKIITRPILGALADHFQKLKLILLVLIVVTTGSRLGMLLIPKNNLPPSMNLITMRSECSTSNLTSVGEYNASCLLEALNSSSVICNQKCGDCYPLSNSNATNRSDVDCTSFCQDEEHMMRFYSNFGTNLTIRTYHTLHALLYTNNSARGNVMCECNVPFTNCSTTCVTETEHCFNAVVDPENDSGIYVSLTFWMFFVLLMFSDVCDSGIVSLADAACYERLEDKPELYGRQRLWGTIGWGATAAAAGYLHDLASESSSKPDYSYGFYLMAALFFADFLVVLKAKIRTDNYSKNLFKDVGSLLKKVEIISFLTSVVFVGIFTAYLPGYVFLYLEEMGASQLLLGLTLTVNCFGAELPFLFFANYIVTKLGCIPSLTLTFIAYAIRYIGYYFIWDPWWALPLELLHGITFGVFYSAVTLHSKKIAPPGTEATMQSLTGAAYDGLGRSIGSLLAGLGFDKLGGRKTFLITGIVSVACAVLNSSLCLLPGSEIRDKKSVKHDPMESSPL